MRFDFSSVDDVESFVHVPEGLHNCRVAEVRDGRARDGSVRWSFRLEVVDGEWAGRTAAWDSLTWSERGIYRVKKVLAALGMDVKGVLEIEPTDLINLRARVRVEPEEREDPVSGQRQVRMRVPYLGYAPCERAEEAETPDSLAPVDGWRSKREPAGDGTPGEDDELAF